MRYLAHTVAMLFWVACCEQADTDSLQAGREDASQHDASQHDVSQHDVSVECGSFSVNGCPSVPDAALTCLQDALVQHKTARLRQTFVSDEGAHIIEDLFIVEDGASWAVLRRVDSRKDAWGPQTLEEFSCSGVAWSGPTVSGCEYVVATGCAP